MKRNIFFLAVLFTFGFAAISQNADHVNGGCFVKSIEYNYIQKASESYSMKFPDIHNVEVKKDIEKLFFGDFNAPVEYIFVPPFEGACALRIYNDSLKKTDILEIKYILNYVELQEEMEEEYPLIGFSSFKEMKTSDWAREHNQEMTKKTYEEMFRRFQGKSICFPVSNQFAKAFFGRIVSFIDNFKATGVPPNIILHSYDATFRTVVEDEVWSLRICKPQSEALQLSDLFRQIIADKIKGEGGINEDKYLKLLNEINE